MNILICRRLALPCAALLMAFNAAAGAAATAVEGTLDLDQAATLAIQHQPLLSALNDAAEAAQQRAVASGQLPDPELSFGISDVPLNTRDRFSLRRDGGTDIMLGLRQAFPREDKRRLRRERGEQEGAVIHAEQQATSRQIARDAGLAWLEVWQAESAQQLISQQLVEAERQVQAITIAYAAGRASQADVLAGKIDAEQLRDAIAEATQRARHTRNGLSRWIGDAAFGAISPVLPDDPAPDLNTLLGQLAEHPHLLVEAQKLALNRTDIALAEQDYRPDVAVQVAFGYRPAFSEMGTVQVQMPLPWFTGQRQDRTLAASKAELSAQQARLADALRKHRAEVRTNVDDWRDLQARLARYDQQLLPQAQMRIDAALADYRSGTGGLNAVLAARRSALDVALQRLALQFDSASHQVQLRYFAP